MAVHAYIGGFPTDYLLVASLIVCGAGLVFLVARWGQGRPARFLSDWARAAFRKGLSSFLRTMVLDVLLLRSIRQRSVRRWAVHMALFWGFIFFGIFTVLSIAGRILGYLDPAGTGGGVARSVAEFHLPYDLLGYLILAAAAIMLARRLLVREVRERTGISDLFLVGSVFAIALTGMFAEWFGGYATFIGPLVQNWDLALEFLSWHMYVVFLLFVMVLPWTRFRHIITVPLTLLARRGGD